MISLKDFLEAEDPVTKAMKVTVLSTEPVKRYTNAAGKEHALFKAEVTDENFHTQIKCNDSKQSSKFVPEAGLINHQTHMTINCSDNKSVVVCCAGPNVLAVVQEAALHPSHTQVMPIIDALHSPNN